MYTPVLRRFLPAECAIVISKQKGRKKCATDAKSGKTRERCDSMYRMRYAQLSGWWIIWICCRYTGRVVCVCYLGVWVCGCNIYIYTRHKGAYTKTRKPQQVACVVTAADLSCIVYKTRTLGRLRNVPI